MPSALKDLIASEGILNVGADGDLPKRFRLAAFGKTGTTNGSFELREADALEMVAHSKRRGIKPSADWEHAALHAVKSGTVAPAAAWYNLEVGEDGLYAADIEWTEKAAAQLKAREYRYFSPWFGQREDGSVGSFKNFGLTNRPAIDALTPLVNAEQSHPAAPPEPPKMETLLKTLALADGATEAQAVAKVNTMNAEREAIFTSLDVDSLPKALAKIQAATQAQSRVTALETELATIRKVEAAKERDTLLSEGITSGRIPPKMKDFWASETMSVAQLKSYLENATPLVVPVGTETHKQRPLDDASLALTEADKKAADMMGVTYEAALKSKTEMAKAREDRS